MQSSATLQSSPLLAALRHAGTAHVYADTADSQELRDVATMHDGHLIKEIDGATVNQPLVRKALARYVEGDRIAASTRGVRRQAADMPESVLLRVLYTMVCSWIGDDLVRIGDAGRQFDVSLQLHMATTGHPATAKELGRWLRRMAPPAIVKVPFTPQAPDCFLVARDLEREGIPVNFTSTFSARQAVAAALLANVTRTNIFMGRLNQGLRAELLGEQAVLEAQRAINRLRREANVRTLLIVASMREWRSFTNLAGCDVFTAPPSVLKEFLAQTEVRPEMIASKLETDYQAPMTIDDRTMRVLGFARITRLWRVEREFIDFLLAYRASDEFRRLEDGEELRRRFESAGFGSVFYTPSTLEWEVLRRNKLPDLASPLTTKLDLDTLYTLLADADFMKEQDAIDAEIARHADVRAAAA